MKSQQVEKVHKQKCKLRAKSVNDEMVLVPFKRRQKRFKRQQKDHQKLVSHEALLQLSK